MIEQYILPIAAPFTSDHNATSIEIHIVDNIGSTRWFSAVKQFYPLVQYHQKVEPTDLVVIATIDDCIVGCCRLCKEEDANVIRGLMVHPHYRGHGIGRSLLKLATDLTGTTECYGLPFTHLEQFYSKVGFRRINERETPEWFLKRFNHYKSQNLDVIIMKKGFSKML